MSTTEGDQTHSRESFRSLVAGYAGTDLEKSKSDYDRKQNNMMFKIRERLKIHVRDLTSFGVFTELSEEEQKKMKTTVLIPLLDAEEIALGNISFENDVFLSQDARLFSRKYISVRTPTEQTRRQEISELSIPEYVLIYPLVLSAIGKKISKSVSHS